MFPRMLAIIFYYLQKSKKRVYWLLNFNQLQTFVILKQIIFRKSLFFCLSSNNTIALITFMKTVIELMLCVRLIWIESRRGQKLRPIVFDRKHSEVAWGINCCLYLFVKELKSVQTLLWQPNQNWTASVKNLLRVCL